MEFFKNIISRLKYKYMMLQCEHYDIHSYRWISYGYAEDSEEVMRIYKTRCCQKFQMDFPVSQLSPRRELVDGKGPQDMIIEAGWELLVKYSPEEGYRIEKILEPPRTC